MKSIFLFLFTPLFCAAQINPVKDSANEWHPYEFQKTPNKIWITPVKIVAANKYGSP